MTHADDNPDKLKADLRKWVLQHEGQGLDWFLDEGFVAETVQAVDHQIAIATEPDESAEQPVAKSSPLTPPPPAPKPAPAIIDPVFKQECERFVETTLRLIAKQPAHQGSGDILLDQFNGDSNQALSALRDEVQPCQACDLAKSRTQVVFGAGSAQAGVLFIGEAPGRDEDLQGEPFVGASGKLLTQIIEAIGFDRNHIFICNILKCRPPGNRDPLREEVEACETYLKRQLAIIRPRIICCLGRVAAQTLLGTDLSLGKLRRGVHFYAGIPVMATYHPAALLRNPAWKRDTWNDVQRLRALHDALELEKT